MRSTHELLFSTVNTPRSVTSRAPARVISRSFNDEEESPSYFYPQIVRYKGKIETLRDLLDSSLESRCEINLPASVETGYLDLRIMRFKSSGLRVLFINLKVYEATKVETLSNVLEHEIDF